MNESRISWCFEGAQIYPNSDLSVSFLCVFFIEYISFVTYRYLYTWERNTIQMIIQSILILCLFLVKLSAKGILFYSKLGMLMCSQLFEENELVMIRPFIASRVSGSNENLKNLDTRNVYTFCTIFTHCFWNSVMLVLCLPLHY